MIPLKLQLKNFLSYGTPLQEIDFSSYNLICLSGKNGHGKSALLDAITWALWGQARKTLSTTKADQGLIRLGQTQMFVALDFMFNGQTYRIRREFAKTYGKPYAVLDFGLLDPERNELIPLTDKTIRLTQEKIEKLLNIDCNSFVNSAFLRQGQANEFSKKSAKDRKNVLATILGLNRYESLRTLALEKIKQAQLQQAHTQTLQQTIQQELTRKPALIGQISALTRTLHDITQQETLIGKEQATIDTQRADLLNEHKEYQLLILKTEQCAQTQEQQQQALRTLVAQWRMINKKIAHIHEQKKLEDRKRELVHEVATQQALWQQSLTLKERLLTLKDKIQQTEQHIKETLLTTATAKKIDLERRALELNTITHHKEQLQRTHDLHLQEQTALVAQLHTLQQSAVTITAQLANLTEVEQQFERRKEYYQQWSAQGALTTTTLEHLLQKNRLVHDDNNPSCPLCEQNLSAARKRLLKSRLQEDEQYFTRRIARLKKITASLKTILIAQHAHLTALRQQSQQLQAITTTAQELEKQRDKLTTLMADNSATMTQLNQQETTYATAYAHAQQELADVLAQQENVLQKNADYQLLVTQQGSLEQELKAFPYNPDTHTALTKALQDVEQRLTEYTYLTEQAALQEQRKQNIRQLCIHLKEIKHQQEALRVACIPFATVATRMNNVEQQEQELRASLKTLSQQKEALLLEKGRLEKEYDTLLALEKECETRLIEYKQSQQTIDDYTAIATATGKDGIQALLIEQAIPEIEQEANQLLAKLTNNQAQIFIESLRDLKSGGTKETLDINISDTIGIRPYEMFSGGEAFRIDFALRIAISKLLARRAGTSLQTLIIDEGFGSQDEEGLSAIMDALYKIQDDFSKIIIVSHLPTMKDQFPVHFVVEKGPNGSIVQVMEQG